MSKFQGATGGKGDGKQVRVAADREGRPTGEKTTMDKRASGREARVGLTEPWSGKTR